MKRREFLAAAGASLLPLPTFANDKPNVLVLIADDMRADLLGVAGDKIIETPTLDRLARNGNYFPEAFVTTSVCPTSRASIMLGQYASRHKNVDFQTSLTQRQWDTSYHGRLQNAGYRTGYIGKWGLGGAPPNNFDTYDGFQGAGQYVAAGRKHLTEHLADRAISFVQNSKSPYCLTVGFWAPHAEAGDDPAPAAPQFRDLYKGTKFDKPPSFSEVYNAGFPARITDPHAEAIFERQLATPERYQRFVEGYFGLISGMDTAISRILAEVDLENTLVVFLSDNGFFLGEHGRPGKWLANEESIRIPFVVHAPGLRGKVNKIALNIDVAPTIYGALGWAHNSDGIGLLDPVNTRDHFFYEYPLSVYGAVGIRTRTKKYVVMPEQEFEMAFDLEVDKFEQTNLAATDLEWVSDLRKIVEARYAGSDLLPRN